MKKVADLKLPRISVRTQKVRFALIFRKRGAETWVGEGLRVAGQRAFEDSENGQFD
jgi:hypothetical protein